MIECTIEDIAEALGPHRPGPRRNNGSYVMSTLPLLGGTHQAIT